MHLSCILYIDIDYFRIIFNKFDQHFINVTPQKHFLDLPSYEMIKAEYLKAKTVGELYEQKRPSL